MPLSTLSGVTVAVIGSGTEEHDDLAREVGALLARLGVNLLTGGGRGVMTAVSRAFTGARPARGISIGIIPCESEEERATPKEGYPNPFVELPLFTHLPYSGARGEDVLSRNHINVLSSAAVVALPGALGTASEVALALRYGKPVIAYAHDRRDLAALPPEVPRATTISAVEQFLCERLKL